MPEPTGTCRACKAPMLWAKMPSGKRNPLDVEPVAEIAQLNDADRLLPVPGLTAYNPETEGGMPITTANLGQMLRWVEEGRVSAHVSHFATCPERDRFKRDG